MKTDKKYRTLAKNTLLFAIGSFGTKILVFLLTPLYTSVLTTDEYGVADIITTTVTLLIYVLTLNISDAVLRFVIEKNEKKEEIISQGIQVISIGAVILGIIVLAVKAINVFNIPQYCYIFVWLGFLSNAFYMLFYNYLQGLNKVSIAVAGGVIQTSVIIFANIIFLVILKTGVIGFLLGTVVGNIAAAVFMFLYILLKEDLHISLFCNDKAILKEMLKYSVPLIFNGIAWWINAGLDKYFITWIYGSGQNGIYSVASKVPTIFTTVMTIFLQSWGLSAIREFDKEDRDGFFVKTFSLFSAVSVLLCSFIVLLNIPVSRILFAKEFFDAWQYSSILLFSSLFSILAGFVGSIFSAVKDTRAFATSTIYAAILNTILNWMLIPKIGVIGAAIATVLSFIFVFVIRLMETRRYIYWRINYMKNLIAFLILAVQIIVEHFENHRYGIQGILFLALLILYYKEISTIVIAMKKKLFFGKK